MRDPGIPRQGRHASSDEGWAAESPTWGAGSSFWAEETPEREAPQRRDSARQSGHGSRDQGPSTVERFAAPRSGGEWMPAAGRRSSDLLERWPDETGPMPQSRHHSGDDGGDDTGPAPRRDDVPQSAHDRGPGGPGSDGRHPSGPLPPMPRSVWSKLGPRHEDETGSADTESADTYGRHRYAADDALTEAHDLDDWDRTGGLEVIGAHVEEDAHRRGPFRRRPAGQDEFEDGHAHEDDGAPRRSGAVDQDIPIAPYDPRPTRRRKRRKGVALLVSLVVLVGLAGGVVVGGQRVWGLIMPKDYTGSGTGSVRIQVGQGETLTAVGQSMVDHQVIASVRPFVKAAEADPNATSITPGIYGLRRHMSGKAALQLLLQPSSRLTSRVTLPEGLTAAQILQRLAQGTGVPLAQLQAAAAAPATLGLPPYANGSLEGFIFPATYDFDPGTSPQKMLQSMVTRTVQTLDELNIPADQRLSVVTEASIVQAEAGSAADMPKVARVLDNRLAKGMPLQLDTTVNYANGKSGLTTTAQDRANPSPYNTYLHTGLPPGPISNPGEDALRAVLSPAQGDWLYFVVVNPDTGETRFAATAEEHQANVQLFQQWLKAHPGG